MNFIVLTGGTSKRFGSDKSEAKIGDRSLLEILCGYLPQGKVIIAGPRTHIDAIYVREVPERSGPLAAIGAGMKEVDSELVGIFATDMPFAPKLIPLLLENLKDDVALPLDKQGKLQPLAGIYRSDALSKALSDYESLANQSMMSLLDKLQINQVPLVETDNLTDYLMDIDTKEALLEAIELQSRLGL